jgi:hypothetical protein
VLTLVQYLTLLAAAFWHTANCYCFVVFKSVFGKDSVNDGVLGESVPNAVKEKVDFALAKLPNHTALLLFTRQVTNCFAVSKVTLSSPMLLMIFSLIHGGKPVFCLYFCTLYFICFTCYNFVIQGKLR